MPAPPSPPPLPPPPVLPVFAEEGDDPEFEEQLRRAIAESQAMAPPIEPVAHKDRPNSSEVNSRSGSAFLADRAEMERQRLERQKRQRPDISHTKNVIPKEEEDSDIVIDDDSDHVRETKRQRVSSSVPTARTNAPSSSQPSRSTTTGSRPPVGDNREELFYEGELRQTANKHVDRAKDTRPVFRLTEILSPVSLSDMAHIDGH